MENKGERHNWFSVRGNRGVSDCEGDGQRAGIMPVVVGGGQETAT